MFESTRDSEAEQVGAAVPYLSADPTREQLPTTADGDPVPVQYISDGSAEVTGDDGDLVLAVPNASGGVDTAVNADVGDLVELGIDADTGLL